MSKPIITITHVLSRAEPGSADTLVAFKQVFATHYLTASRSLTARPGFLLNPTAMLDNLW